MQHRTRAHDALGRRGGAGEEVAYTDAGRVARRDDDVGFLYHLLRLRGQSRVVRPPK